MNAEPWKTLRAFYQRVLALLADGDWHSEAELAELTAYSCLWVAELRRTGHVIEQRDGQLRLLASADEL